MIYVLAMRDNRHPMRAYLSRWGARVRWRMRVVEYGDLPAADALPNATYVFCDVDRMPPALRERAAALHARLATRGDAVRLLNDPLRSLDRVGLLRDLHAAGINDFRAYRLDEPRAAMRYPVFVRPAVEHRGASTPLLGDPAALASALADLRARGIADDDLLIVEYVEVGDGDLHRKYAATRVGERLLAHHVMFDRRWEVKGPSLVSDAMVAEERAFQEAHPHRAELEAVFARARIDYGRIDYGVVGGRIQVWEINTNPTLLYPPARYTAAQLPAKRWFSARLDAAFEAIDDRSAPRVPWRLQAHLLRRRLGRRLGTEAR